jgi:hypothetical protein
MAIFDVSSRRMLSHLVSSQRGHFGPPVPPGLRIISARDEIDRPDSQEEKKDGKLVKITRSQFDRRFRSQR